MCPILQNEAARIQRAVNLLEGALGIENATQDSDSTRLTAIYNRIQCGIMKQNKLYESVDAAEYLGIPLEKFLGHTNYKATLCYLLRNGQRMYKQSELDRFKTEVLDA